MKHPPKPSEEIFSLGRPNEPDVKLRDSRATRPLAEDLLLTSLYLARMGLPRSNWTERWASQSVPGGWRAQLGDHLPTSTRAGDHGLMDQLPNHAASGCDVRNG